MKEVNIRLAKFVANRWERANGKNWLGQGDRNVITAMHAQPIIFVRLIEGFRLGELANAGQERRFI